MKVIAIAAVGKNGAIGHAGELPWNIPEDMKFFRDATREQIVVMGRKTYQSLQKALPKRENAVITRDVNFQLSDARVFHALKDALAFYKSCEDLAGKTIFVIGGGEIYTLAIPMLDEIWLTEVDAEFKGDAFFPSYRSGKLDLPEFAASPIKMQEDLASPFRYKFTRYARV